MPMVSKRCWMPATNEYSLNFRLRWEGLVFSFAMHVICLKDHKLAWIDFDHGTCAWSSVGVLVFVLHSP